MAKSKKTEVDHVAEARTAVLKAAIGNAVFDGWGEPALRQAVADAGVDAGLAKLAFPRGALDLALAFHFDGDARLAEAMATEDMSALRYSQKVARALEIRLELIADDREAVRKAVAYFALPIHAAEGAKAIWHTADTIWKGLGDTSEDINWYTKRATLSTVWSSVVLYWLGDESPDFQNTRAFIARRIDNVMQIEKAKAAFRNNPLGRLFAKGPGRIFENVCAPGSPRDDLPGSLKGGW